MIVGVVDPLNLPKGVGHEPPLRIGSGPASPSSDLGMAESHLWLVPSTSSFFFFFFFFLIVF
jgi:hypothetical protein